MDIPEWIVPDRPVVIAGPTASGKSALALAIARRQGGVIINADALQVWSCWSILSARPSAEEEAEVPHILFGHRHPGEDYSVGHWLREVADVLGSDRRPIIVGGTGLYLTALTEGLADIPATPPEVRAEADRRVAEKGHLTLLTDLDPETTARIDTRNPARVQRAWEVQRATGQGLAEWQDATGQPILPISKVTPIRIDADRDWLAGRIDRRFEEMIDAGAIEEVRAVLPYWDSRSLWSKAIGAPELVAHLRGTLGRDDAIRAAQASSRQYAKRQRTWLRSRMKAWRAVARP